LPGFDLLILLVVLLALLVLFEIVVFVEVVVWLFLNVVTSAGCPHCRSLSYDGGSEAGLIFSRLGGG